MSAQNNFSNPQAIDNQQLARDLYRAMRNAPENPLLDEFTGMQKVADSGDNSTNTPPQFSPASKAIIRQFGLGVSDVLDEKLGTHTGGLFSVGIGQDDAKEALKNGSGTTGTIGIADGSGGFNALNGSRIKFDTSRSAADGKGLTMNFTISGSANDVNQFVSGLKDMFRSATPAEHTSQADQTTPADYLTPSQTTHPSNIGRLQTGQTFIGMPQNFVGGYNNGFMPGYNNGMMLGYNNGFMPGYNNGFMPGYNNRPGYPQGYPYGYQQNYPYYPNMGGMGMGGMGMGGMGMGGMGMGGMGMGNMFGMGNAMMPLWMAMGFVSELAYLTALSGGGSGGSSTGGQTNPVHPATHTTEQTQQQTTVPGQNTTPGQNTVPEHNHHVPEHHKVKGTGESIGIRNNNLSLLNITGYGTGWNGTNLGAGAYDIGTGAHNPLPNVGQTPMQLAMAQQQYPGMYPGMNQPLSPLASLVIPPADTSNTNIPTYTPPDDAKPGPKPKPNPDVIPRYVPPGVLPYDPRPLP